MAVFVTIAVFWLIHGLLGDPTLLILGRDADPQTVQRVRHELGLDRHCTSNTPIGSATRLAVT